MAPAVPGWPGAALREDTGGSWPGATARSHSWPGASGRADAVTATGHSGGQGGVAAILFPAVAVLLMLAVVGLWVFLDADHRQAQMISVIVVVALAVVGLGVSVWRHRSKA